MYKKRRKLVSTGSAQARNNSESESGMAPTCSVLRKAIVADTHTAHACATATIHTKTSPEVRIQLLAHSAKVDRAQPTRRIPARRSVEPVHAATL